MSTGLILWSGKIGCSRDQRPEDRSQRTEVRSQRSEIRSQRLAPPLAVTASLIKNETDELDSERQSLRLGLSFFHTSVQQEKIHNSSKERFFTRRLVQNDKTHLQPSPVIPSKTQDRL